MLLLISPAKTLDFESQPRWKKCSEARLLGQSEVLMQALKPFSADDLGKLMGVSPKIAELNHQRNQSWALPMDPSSSRPALQAFMGDVYEGLDAQSLKASEVTYLQKHLRILSGLYGLLRPLDLMLPYRLEMGCPLKNANGKNLYEFWGDTITDLVIEDLGESRDEKCIINLASNEYIKSVNKKKLVKELGMQWVTPQFKDWKNGQYKMISFYAKRARGLMVRFICQRGLRSETQLKDFDLEGYAFNEELSSPNEPVFTRKAS